MFINFESHYPTCDLQIFQRLKVANNAFATFDLPKMFKKLKKFPSQEIGKYFWNFWSPEKTTFDFKIVFWSPKKWHFWSYIRAGH